MPLTQSPLRPIQVDRVCDKCGEGRMRPTGVALASYPPLFPHKCESCGAIDTFRQQYPTLRYAQEGQLLDLTKFKETE